MIFLNPISKTRRLPLKEKIGAMFAKLEKFILSTQKHFQNPYYGLRYQSRIQSMIPKAHQENLVVAEQLQDTSTRVAASYAEL